MNTIELLEELSRHNIRASIKPYDGDAEVEELLETFDHLPALLKLARSTWALMDADRRILAYPPHREAAIKKAALEVEAALEPLFREVPS